MTRPSSSPRRTGPSHSRVLLLLAISVLCALLLLSVALPAMASAPGQDTAATPESTAQPTAAPVVVVTPRPAPVGSDLLGLTIIILGFAIGAVVAALLYSYNIQMKYYDAATSLGVSGVPVKTTSESTFAAVPSGAQDDDGSPPAVVPVITGPALVSVGVQSGEFSVAAEGALLAKATWRVEPANIAIVIPPTGDTVKVVAAMPGAFKLYAKGQINGVDTAEAALDVAAVAVQREAVELPFVGRAYGSVILGIILTATVILLALAGVLSEAVVVALLTTLLGYTFGVAVANRPAE